MDGDLASPVVLLFCHFQSGYAAVNVLKLPHHTAQCFMRVATAYAVATRDKAS